MSSNIHYLLYGQDRLGDNAQFRFVGDSVTRGDHISVLPHHKLWGRDHVTDQALQLQTASCMNIQVRSTNNINLEI